MTDMLLQADRNLFFFFNSTLANPLADLLMPALTAKGYLLYLPFVGYMLYLGFLKKEAQGSLPPKTAILIIFLALCSFGISDWTAFQIKQLIARQRPCNALEGVRLLVNTTKSFSLPSNHAANAFSFSVACICLARRHMQGGFVMYLLGLAFLIAVSRVYVGVHYPLDVLAGAVWGSLTALAVAQLYGFLGRRFTKLQGLV